MVSKNQQSYNDQSMLHNLSPEFLFAKLTFYQFFGHVFANTIILICYLHTNPAKRTGYTKHIFDHKKSYSNYFILVLYPE